MQLFEIDSNLTHLDKLWALRKIIDTTECENVTRIKKLEEENAEIWQNLTVLTENKVALQKQMQSRLFFLHFCSLTAPWELKEQIINLGNCLDAQLKILGYSLSETSWDEEFEYVSVKFYFNESFYVQFGISNSGLVDLLDILPQHMNFGSIQEHFRNTQDTFSLLSTLRSYFRIMEIDMEINKP